LSCIEELVNEFKRYDWQEKFTKQLKETTMKDFRLKEPEPHQMRRDRRNDDQFEELKKTINELESYKNLVSQWKKNFFDSQKQVDYLIGKREEDQKRIAYWQDAYVKASVASLKSPAKPKKIDIWITEEDVGKRVRLRDGSVTIITGFFPKDDFKVKVDGESYQINGFYQINNGSSPQDIVEVL
jgi:hypothetical protein